jgi:hypothetical protein
MLKPFKDWEIHKVLAVILFACTLVTAAYTKLPLHATFVLVLCLVLASFFIFYPWRFPKWIDAGGGKTADDFYPVMRLGWLGFITLAAIVGFLWPATNFVWVKSPDILVERMQETHLDVQLDMKMAREGVWDANLVQKTPAAAPILVALPPLDQNRLPQATQERRCVPAIQALRVAFGELSSYSNFLSLVMIMAMFFGLFLAGAERLHEARLNADEKRKTPTVPDSAPKN